MKILIPKIIMSRKISLIITIFGTQMSPYKNSRYPYQDLNKIQKTKQIKNDIVQNKQYELIEMIQRLFKHGAHPKSKLSSRTRTEVSSQML